VTGWLHENGDIHVKFVMFPICCGAWRCPFHEHTIIHLPALEGKDNNITNGKQYINYDSSINM
jgi:hypothetical protein